MHEFSLCQEILKIVLETARKHAVRRVGEVRVDVGSAGGVNTSALNYAWQYLRTTSDLTATAILAINLIQAWGNCSHCNYEGELDDIFRLCQKCGSGGFRLVRGTEFMVTGISGE